VHQTRTFASVLPATSAAASVSAAAPKTRPSAKVDDARQPGAARPHLGVKVDPNHGLYAFFRKTEEKDGVTKYETVENLDYSKADTGASVG
jgi:large subunit ribosomal protein L47